jgi:CHAT domain-containing protein
VLTPPAVASEEDDGLLTASEASQLDISADWVILSACNTASAAGAEGNDSLSALARGFLHAGAHALLASHWRVSDDATAALTVETLSAWQADPAAGQGEALRRAMHAVRTGKHADGTPVTGWTAAWAHPGSWAPFTHIANRDD